MGSFKVIGIGNEHRGDDAVGLVVARAVRKRLGDCESVVEMSGEGAGLIEEFQDFDTVVVVDAARSGADAGTIHRFDAGIAPLPTRFFHYSTHAFGLGEAVEVARRLGRLPPRLIVFGVEGKSFTVGMPVSDPVRKAADLLAEEIANGLDSL